MVALAVIVVVGVGFRKAGASLVWYDVSKKLHIYGYRYAFIPSIIHQNILVLRRQEPRKRARPGGG